MEATCLRCGKEKAASEIKFALGKPVRTEVSGNTTTRYHEGPAFSVPVCTVCFNRFHEGDPPASKILVFSMEVGGVATAIAGIVYVTFINDIPRWSTLSFNGSYVLYAFQLLLMVFLTAVVWMFVAGFTSLPGVAIGFALSSPAWAHRLWRCRKVPYAKLHPAYRKFRSLGYKDIFWTNKDGESEIKSESFTYYT